MDTIYSAPCSDSWWTPPATHSPNFMLAFSSKHFPLLSGLSQREMQVSPLFPMVMWDDLRDSSDKFFPCDDFVVFVNKYVALTSYLCFLDGLA